MSLLSTEVLEDRDIHRQTYRQTYRHSPRYRLLLFVLILFAYGWRVNGLTQQSLWRDEVDAIYFALRDLPDTLAMFVAMAQNGPLYFLSLRLWFSFVGASEFALRYISVLAGTAAIPLTWQVARRILGGPTTSSTSAQTGQGQEGEGKRTNAVQWSDIFRIEFSLESLSLWAALFMAINPYQLWYGQEGKMYALITLLTLMAHWLWLQGISQKEISQGRWRIWCGYLLTVSCAIYSHLLMIMIIPLHMLWFLLAWPKSKFHWRGYGGALAGLIVPYLPLLAWQWPMLLATEPKTGFNFIPLPEMVESLVMSHTIGLLPPLPWLQLLPMLFLAIVGILLGGGALYSDSHTEQRIAAQTISPGEAEITPASTSAQINQPQATSIDIDVVRQPIYPERLTPWRRHALLLSWLLFPIGMIYLLSMRQPVYTDRYVIWIAPALLILMALGARTILENAGSFARPLVIALLLYTIGFWAYTGWQEKTTTIKYDLRAGVTYIAERRDPTALLILQIPHQQWAWQYYTSDFAADLFDDGAARLGNWAEGIWTNNGQSDDEAVAAVNEQMQAISAGNSEIWLLSSEVEMWDRRHLMRAWLDAHGTLIDQAEFHGVQARHYELHN